MSQKLYKIFTHCDLDGAVSLLTFLWAKSEDTVEFEEIYNTDVVEKLLKYKEKTFNPPPTLILDVALRPELIQFDSPQFTFIDHHKSSQPYLIDFKHSKNPINPVAALHIKTYNRFYDYANFKRI